MGKALETNINWKCLHNICWRLVHQPRGVGRDGAGRDPLGAEVLNKQPQLREAGVTAIAHPAYRKVSLLGKDVPKGKKRLVPAS
jgi:hypothetical protein